MDISKIFEKARNEKKPKEKPVDEEQKEEDIKQYYKTFDLKKLKDKKKRKR